MTRGWTRKSATLAALTVLGASLLTAGWTEASAATSGKPIEGGKIMMFSSSGIKDLDPMLTYDGISYEVVEQLYERLVTYKGSPNNPVADLASSWKISKDGKTYTFRIRKGVKFWNGDKLTAQNFIDEFQRVLGPKSTSPGEGFADPIIAGSTAYHQGKAKSISGIQSPNPYTLVIHLTKPEPFFLQILAMPFFAAVDMHYIKQVGATSFDATKAMGTGPFMLKSIDTDQVVLVKNPHYWMKDKYGNSIPYLDQVTIKTSTNDQLDALNFEQGRAALMADVLGVPSSQYPTMSHNPTYAKDIITMPSNAIQYVGLNVNVKPFNNPLVRQAVEYAINKTKIVQLMNGRVSEANQPLPPGIKGYMKNLPKSAQYSYNPTLAKKLLAKAGYPHGFKTTLYTANIPDWTKIATSIQNDLSQIGITASINQTPVNTYFTMLAKGTFGIFQSEWGQDFPDASDFLNTLLNSNQRPFNNTTMYSNKQVDAWLNKAQTDPNQSQRVALYNKVTVQVMKDATWVPLFYPVYTYAVQPWVHGFYMNQSESDPLQYLWIDPGHSQ